MKTLISCWLIISSLVWTPGAALANTPTPTAVTTAQKEEFVLKYFGAQEKAEKRLATLHNQILKMNDAEYTKKMESAAQALDRSAEESSHKNDLAKANSLHLRAKNVRILKDPVWKPVVLEKLNETMEEGAQNGGLAIAGLVIWALGMVDIGVNGARWLGDSADYAAIFLGLAIIVVSIFTFEPELAAPY